MKKILLIEDNQEVRENTAEILTLAGYDVSTAENGKKGVELAQTNQPDLIVCDIMMPVLDGYGTLHILNKNAKTASIPFIFLTAKADRSDLRKGMLLGADDYLTKPFEESELLDAIESRIKRHETLTHPDHRNGIDGLNSFIQSASSMDALKSLSETKKARHYEKKSTLYWEGDHANAVLYILSGKVKAFKTNHDGKQLITGIYGPGEFIGYNALLSNAAHSETTQTMENTDICKILRQEFFELIYAHRDIANMFISLLSNNLNSKEELLLHMAYDNVRQRVASVLKEVSKRYNDEQFTMPREDLAAMVGTAPESVIRTLSDFKHEGLLEVNAGQIKILDQDRLTRMIEKGY